MTRQEPLPAERVVGRTPVLKEPLLEGGRRFWLEQRPGEGGRTTLLLQPADGSALLELTPGGWNLRSRVHDYGGGVYSVQGDTAVVVDDRDRCLWSLDLSDPHTAAAGARRLTAPDPERQFADGRIDAGRQRWIGVMEAQERDHLVAVPLQGGEPELLRRAADFCGYAVLSPDGGHLAWVEWQQPSMPWERSQLWLGRFGADGALEACRPVAGSAEAGPGCSVFQPLWLGDGSLVVANDRSGWWNLERLRAEAVCAALEQPGEPPWEPLLPLEAEFAMPQWVYGMRTTCWDGRTLMAAACREGRWELGAVPLDPGAAEEPAWRPLDLPFDDLAMLQAEAGRLVCVASGPTSAAGLLEVELATGRWQHSPVEPPPLPLEAISRPEPLWFPGAGGAPTHAWYYPPRGGGHPAAPLLVKSHSGPTAMARTGLNPAIQYWTSRGWGVVDVNYGGSTGFGRSYRERLNGGWGVVDVADCAAAARAVVEAGRAGADRIAIEGGSAGGFTTLAALCFTDVFRAGACRYGVADLASLAADTHRFEARYLDGLVGPWPAARALYEQRSPLLQAGRIRTPVIFFQGSEDRVVPPEQTESMAAALRAHGVPVEVMLFEGEGHGFRDGAVQRQVLEATEAFFRRVLSLEEAP
ncbi:MAG: prolyl oligopeptidase family serine peptidase [Prochlorococcaceae cyanobacterium]